MKVIKKALLPFLVVFSLSGSFGSTKAFAAGILVADVALIHQMIIDFIREGEHWKVTLEEYKRSLDTLNILQERIKRFDHFTSGDIAEMLAVAAPYFGNEQLNILISLDPESPDFVELILYVLDEDMGHAVKEFPELETIIASFEGDPLDYKSEAERNEYVQKLYVDEVSKAATSSILSEKRDLAIDAYGVELKQLGDQSDLATMQLTAGQLHLIMQQNEQVIRSLSDMAVANKHSQMMSASSEAETREEELNYIASRHNISFRGRSEGDPTVQ